MGNLAFYTLLQVLLGNECQSDLISTLFHPRPKPEISYPA